MSKLFITNEFMTTNDNIKESKQEIIESIKQTCFDCIDYDGQTVTWQSVLDKYLDEILTKALTAQKEKMVKETLVILDKAELEQWFDMPNSTDNWKTWKRIRNTISDIALDDPKRRVEKL